MACTDTSGRPLHGVILENTTQAILAHARADCRALRPPAELPFGTPRRCPLHHRTPHHMRSWPQHWRDDRGIMERICSHGVGHPDPDDPGADPIHGCDGCCVPRCPVCGAADLYAYAYSERLCRPCHEWWREDDPMSEPDPGGPVSAQFTTEYTDPLSGASGASLVYAESREAAQAVANQRRLGEQVQPRDSFFFTPPQEPSFYLWCLGEDRGEERRNLGRLMHAVIWVSHLALSSGVAYPQELFCDDGLAHATAHFVERMLDPVGYATEAERAEAERADLEKRWHEFERRVPGLTHDWLLDRLHPDPHAPVTPPDGLDT